MQIVNPAENSFYIDVSLQGRLPYLTARLRKLASGGAGL